LVELRAFSTRSGGIQLFDQRTEQTPEMIFSGIAADAADFAAPIDQYEQRGQPLDVDKRQVCRQFPRYIDAPQRHAPALVRFAVDWRDIAVEGFAPFAAGLFEHREFGGPRVRQTQHNKHCAKQNGARK
jgi:hypothetical protein